MSRPLVAQLTYSYRPVTGGADAYADDLHHLLIDSGLESLVFQRFAPGAEGADLRFVPNPLRRLPFSFWTQALFVPWQRRELNRAAAVICHYPPYLLALRGVRRPRRQPALIGLSHGVFWDDRPHALRSRIKRALARAAFRHADAYVANDTHFLREVGLDVAPGTCLHQEVAPRRWFIPCCVDTERWQPTAPLPELARLRPLVVPRNLFHNRGIHLAIQAFARFLPDHPDTHLVIVGARSQSRYAAYLERLITGLGLEDKVIFWGPVPRQCMASVYAGALLTVIPSLCGEGTSLAALESMACGTPAVTTNVAGLADLPGLQAPPEPDGLAGAFARACAEREALAARQRARVHEAYSLPLWRQGWRRVLAQCGVPVEA